MEIKRAIEQTLKQYMESFPFVLITGAMQVGKASLAKQCYPDYKVVSFNDLLNQLSCKQDPKGFVSMHNHHVIFEEVQNAPKIFPYLKLKTQEHGCFLLTSSLPFTNIRNISVSLAGHIGVINMMGISLRERNGIKDVTPFLPTKENIGTRTTWKTKSIKELWTIIHEGSYPAVVSKETESARFYPSYFQTYLEREVPASINHLAFTQFVTIVATKTGQLLNYQDIARKSGISGTTVKAWISVLRETGLVYLLQPYVPSQKKRSSPKLYFLDTGLACYLTRWSDPDVLANGYMAGAMSETFVVSEILKSWTNAGKQAPLSYYQDNTNSETIMLLEENNIVYPVAIKKITSQTNDDTKIFKHIPDPDNKKVAPGIIICATDFPVALEGGNWAIPVSWL